MKFGFAVPAYGKAVDAGIAELVDAGEELGFDSAWWPDHIAVPEYATAVNLQTPFLEPLAACAWGLGRTSRLRFGTDVLVAPYRHPLAVAAMIGTMGALAGDRLVLGVGIGYLRGEFEVLGADYDTRAATTEDWVRALREPPDGFSVVQAPARVPVWIGGNNRRAHRRAALLGDGWHPLWLPPEEYAAARARDPRHPARGRPRRAVHVLVQRRPHPVLRRARGRLAAGSATAPEGSEFRYSPEFWMAPDGRPRLVGSPDDLIGDLQLLADAGVDHVTLRFGTVDLEPYERFAAEVLPAFV